jgi:AsmA protein
MKKFVKVIGFIVFALVALIVALPWLVPVDYIFKQVTESVTQTTGRQLVINGEKSLSFFPQLKLELNDVALTNIEQGSEPNMATMEQLAIHIPYLSVLTGDIKLDKFVLRNPKILLEKMPNGKANWQLFESVPDQAQAQTEEESTSSDSSPSLPSGIDIQLGEVAIYGGSFNYIDHQAGASHEISDLNLSIQLPSLKEALVINGSVSYMDEVFELQLSLTTPEKLLLSQDFTMQTQLESQLINVKFDGEITKQLSDFSGDVNIAGGSVKAIAKWQDQIIDAKDEAFNAFALDASMHLANNTFTLNSLNAELDKLAITGHAQIELAKKPMITADIELGMLNVNPYLPKSIDVPEQDTPETNSDAPAEPIVWDDTAIDLSALNTVNTDIKVAATGFQFKQIKLGETQLTFKLKDALAQLSLNKFNAYDGRGEGEVVINAQRSPYLINTSFSLSGIQSEPLLKDAVGIDKLMGQGEVSLALNVKGQSQKAFINSLHGVVGFGFSDGAVKGVNVAAMVRGAEQLITEGKFDAEGLEKTFDDAERTDFSKLQGSFTFNDGVSKTNELSLNSPLLRINGEGDINLPDTEIDYRLVTGIVNSIEGQGSTDKSTGFKIPLRIKGPFHQVSIKPDIGEAAKEKAKDKLKDKLKSWFN